MVHGGGHHHAGGGGAGGSSSSWSGGGSSSYHHSTVHHYHHNNGRGGSSSAEGCTDEDCKNCANGCCACWLGIGACAFITCCCPKHLRGVTIFAVWVWLMLWVTTFGIGTHSVSQTKEITLNVGETWQVKPPPLWSRTSWSIQSSTVDPVGVEIFQIPPNPTKRRPGRDKCNSLSGPIKTLQQGPEELAIEIGDYQYDYFRLNSGSVVNLDVKQTMGWCYIYILKGSSVLKQVENPTYDENDSMTLLASSSVVKKWYSGNNASHNFTYTAPDTDFYMIFYANPFWSAPFKVIVGLNLQITTHDLKGLEPVCTVQDTFTPGGCQWKVGGWKDRNDVGTSCFIAQAVSSTPASSQAETNTLDASQVVMFRLKSPVGSPLLILLVVTPVAFWLWRCATTQDGSDGNAQDETNENVVANKPEEAAPLVATRIAPRDDYRSIQDNATPLEAHAVLVDDGMSANSYADAPIVMEGVVPLAPPGSNKV